MSKLTCSYRPKIYSRCMLLLYVVITIVGVSACQPKEIGLPFETIEKRDASGTGQVYEDKQPGLIILAKPEEVANLDALVTPDDQARLRSLNYDTHFVIAAFQGRKPTTGYSIEIERIIRRRNTVTIYALSQGPKPDEAKGDEETSPYHLVGINKVGDWGQQINFDLVVNDAVVASLSQVVP